MKNSKAEKAITTDDASATKLAEILAMIPEPSLDHVIEELHDVIAAYDGIDDPYELPMSRLMEVKRVTRAIELLEELRKP